MIAALMDAARSAREASSVLDDSRTVEIVITEIGLVVRGRAKADDRAYAASFEVRWEELQARPSMATFAVGRVVDALAASTKGGQD